MISLKSRLLLADEECCSAFIEGGDVLSAFSQRWEVLVKDVDFAIDASQLDQDTATLAHTIALRIAFLADACSELHTTCDAFTSELIGEVESLVASLTLVDDITTESTTPRRSSSEPRGVTTRTGSATSEAGVHSLPQRSKRRRATSAHSSSVSDSLSERSCKRRRPSAVYSKTSDAQKSQTSPITPPIYSGLPTLPTATFHRVELESIPVVVVPSRKRRRSDTDVSAMPNRPRLPFSRPRLHAVSDSFSVLTSQPRVQHPTPSPTPLILAPMLEDGAAFGRLSPEPFYLRQTTVECEIGFDPVEPSRADKAWNGVEGSSSVQVDEFLDSLLHPSVSPLTPSSSFGPTPEVTRESPGLHISFPISVLNSPSWQPIPGSPWDDDSESSLLSTPPPYPLTPLPPPSYAVSPAGLDSLSPSSAASSLPSLTDPTSDLAWKSLLNALEPLSWPSKPPPYGVQCSASGLEGNELSILANKPSSCCLMGKAHDFFDDMSQGVPFMH